MKFSEQFGICKTQSELDFVDILVNTDTHLFIDPWAIRQGEDDFSVECFNLISSYFELLLSLIKQNKSDDAMRLLDCLHEPHETHLGFTKAGTSGLGIGRIHAEDIYKKLSESMAVKTGLLKDLEDCALMIDNINMDKISDMVTNIIRKPLLEYTRIQCELHDIPTRQLPSGYYWNSITMDWETDTASFPIFEGKKIILVPKFIVRKDLSLNPQEYYNFDMLEFEQARHLDAGTSLCRTLKSGLKKEPSKKSLREIIPEKKESIYSFSRENPIVLEKYKQRKAEHFRPITNQEIEQVRDDQISNEDPETLINKLSNIAPGHAACDEYHNLMIGILSKLFYPNLINPKKEEPRNEKRKRIDISWVLTR